MQFILATDYAIRSVLYLTVIDRMATAAEISEKVNVPKQYFIAMANKLVAAGVLSAAQGVNGGYYLAKVPEQITLLDIVNVTEGTTRVNRCMEQDRICSCTTTGKCRYQVSCQELQSLMDYYLSGVTMREMAEESGAAERDNRELERRYVC